MVKAKALSFLNQPREKVKNHYLGCSLCLVEKRKRWGWSPPMGDVATTWREKKVRAWCSSWENGGLTVWILSPKTKKCDLWKASGDGWWDLVMESLENGEREGEEEKTLEKREWKRECDIAKMKISVLYGVRPQPS